MRDAFAGIVHARMALGKDHPRVSAVVQNLSVHDPTRHQLALMPSSVRLQLKQADDTPPPPPSSATSPSKAITRVAPSKRPSICAPLSAASSSSPTNSNRDCVAIAAKDIATRKFPTCGLAAPPNAAASASAAASSASSNIWQRPAHLPPPPNRSTSNPSGEPLPPARASPASVESEGKEKASDESMATRLARRRKERSEQRSPSSSASSLRPYDSPSSPRADTNSGAISAQPAHTFIEAIRPSK